jgi:DNA mismatch repair protein MSH4
MKLIILPTKQEDFRYMEQSANNVLMLKAFINSIKPVWQALNGATSQELQKIQQVPILYGKKV